MRYEKGRREATRQHIVEVASRRFREGGISGSGLSGVMEQAGLTIGAFSGHFNSKEELVCEALAFALEEQADTMQVAIKETEVEGWLSSYLSKDHANNPAIGCPSAATLAEVGRLPKRTKLIYKRGLLRTIELLRDYLPKTSKISADESVAIFALMVGTLQIARAMPDAETAAKVLDSGLSAARVLAGLPATPLATKSAVKSPKKKVDAEPSLVQRRARNA
jgi:TetR/AcrR family transcriptional regulator, transcriptional repressor for nem operon